MSLCPGFVHSVTLRWREGKWRLSLTVTRAMAIFLHGFTPGSGEFLLSSIAGPSRDRREGRRREQGQGVDGGRTRDSSAQKPAQSEAASGGPASRASAVDVQRAKGLLLVENKK